MSFLSSSSLFHTSHRQAPFTWTFTEAVQFKRGDQGQSAGIVTGVMSHCSLWSSLYTIFYNVIQRCRVRFERGAGTRNKSENEKGGRNRNEREGKRGGNERLTATIFLNQTSPSSLSSIVCIIIYPYRSDLHIAHWLPLCYTHTHTQSGQDCTFGK